MKKLAPLLRRLFLCLLTACFATLLVCQFLLWQRGEDGVARIAGQLGAELKNEQDEIAAAANGEAALFVYLTLEAKPAAPVTLLVNGEAAGNLQNGLLGVRVNDGDELALGSTEAGIRVSVVDFPAVLDSTQLSAEAETVRGELTLGTVVFR